MAHSLAENNPSTSFHPNERCQPPLETDDEYNVQSATIVFPDPKEVKKTNSDKENNKEIQELLNRYQEAYISRQLEIDELKEIVNHYQNQPPQLQLQGTKFPSLININTSIKRHNEELNHILEKLCQNPQPKQNDLEPGCNHIAVPTFDPNETFPPDDLEYLPTFNPDMMDHKQDLDTSPEEEIQEEVQSQEQQQIDYHRNDHQHEDFNNQTYNNNDGNNLTNVESYNEYYQNDDRDMYNNQQDYQSYPQNHYEQNQNLPHEFEQLNLDHHHQQHNQDYYGQNYHDHNQSNYQDVEYNPLMNQENY